MLPVSQIFPVSIKAKFPVFSLSGSEGPNSVHFAECLNDVSQSICLDRYGFVKELRIRGTIF